MSAIIARIRQEPALLSGALAALLALLLAFGIRLSADQTAAITAVATLVLAFIVRANVTPTPPAAG